MLNYSYLASLLHCLSVGCACTILCKALATRNRTCLEGRCSSDISEDDEPISPWRRWTRMGMTRLFRIWGKNNVLISSLSHSFTQNSTWSQLAGKDDMAKKVFDKLSASFDSKRSIIELPNSIFESKSSRRRFVAMEASFKLWMDDVKLITLHVSSY